MVLFNKIHLFKSFLFILYGKFSIEVLKSEGFGVGCSK